MHYRLLLGNKTEFVLNEKGKGQGGVILAARPSFNKEGVLEVES